MRTEPGFKPSASLRAILSTGPVRLAVFASVFIVLSIAAPLIILFQLDPDQRSTASSLVTAPFALLCALMLLVYFATDGLRLHHTLRALGHSLPGSNMSKLVFINILFSNLTPMATGGGLAQIWYLRRHGVHYGTAAAATSVRTVLAMLLIFIPAPIAFALIDPTPERIASDWGPFVLGGAAALYLIGTGLMLARPMWLTHLVASLLSVLTKHDVVSAARSQRWIFRLRRETLRFSRGIRCYLAGSKLDVLLSIAYTAGFLLTLFSFPALITSALGYDPGYWLTVGLMTITTLIAYVAPTPGASGVAEGAFALLFASRLGATDLVVAVVLWRFLTIYLGMLIGALIVAYEVMRRRRSRA